MGGFALGPDAFRGAGNAPLGEVDNIGDGGALGILGAVGGIGDGGRAPGITGGGIEPARRGAGLPPRTGDLLTGGSGRGFAGPGGEPAERPTEFERPGTGRAGAPGTMAAGLAGDGSGATTPPCRRDNFAGVSGVGVAWA